MNAKTRIILLTSVMIIMMTGTPLVSAGNNPPDMVANLTEKVLNSVTIIDGNDELAKNGGNHKGTLSDPYILEFDLSSSSDKDTLVTIRNTDKFFVITNSVLRGGNVSILLENVRNGMVVESTISDTNYGIYLKDTLGNSIRHNTITDYAEFGIALYSSHHNNIAFNELVGNTGDALGLLQTFGGGGIKTDPSNYNTITGNRISNSIVGVLGEDSVGVDVTENVIFNNYKGIEFVLMTDSSIKWNKISQNGHVGISISESKRVSMSGNTMSDNGKGIVVDGKELHTARAYDGYVVNSGEVEATQVQLSSPFVIGIVGALVLVTTPVIRRKIRTTSRGI